MLYRPKLSNGQLVQMEWPLKLYRYLNIICWPLAEDANYMAYLFDRFCWLLAFLLFFQHNDAELRYLIQNFNNLDELLTGMPTYLILIEMHMRVFQLGFQKPQLRRFLQKFYAQIYIEESRNPELYQRIRRQLRPVFALSIMYNATLILHLLIPIMNIIYQRKDLLYKMTYPFDHTPTFVYLPLIISNIWVGVIVTTALFGEIITLANSILHLNGRYILLREDLELRIAALMLRTGRGDGENIAREFRREIIMTIQQNVKLNKFSAEMQAQFSFRIFVQFAFSAALLCALGFKVYTNPIGSIAYGFWMSGKILELLAIGLLGSTIIYTTNGISSMFYECCWESVILRSSDTRENVRLQKLILLAIETNQKPFFLTGLNFFSVSLTAVLTILQCAGSYFTCLISFR